MTYREGQIVSTQAQLLRSHAEITSGAYKLRNVQRGTIDGEWRDMSEDELLQDSMQTMQCHIDRLNALVDKLEVA